MTHASSKPETGAAPTLVVWEAWREQDPGRPWREDLSTMEAMRLMNEVRCFGRVAFLLVGRPLRRADVVLLVEHGARIGLSMRLAPGADVVTPELMTDLRDAGLMRIVFDSAQRAPASLLEDVARARVLGLGVHVATEVTTAALSSLAAQAQSYAAAGVHVWQLAFGPHTELHGEALDGALRGIIALARGLPMQLEVNGAPQVQRLMEGADVACVTTAPGEGADVFFIGADGTLQPSASLRVSLGNARHDDVVDVFNDAWELCALRDPDQLHGKCGRCEFRYLCGGGSRARAFEATQDWLAPDPACEYEPEGSA